MSDQNEPANAKTDGGALARIVVRGTVWTTIGNYANQVIGFVATLWLTHLLKPDVFGAFALASFWYGLLNLRSKIGLTYAAIQSGPITPQLLGTYFFLDVAMALVSLLIMVGFVSVSWLTGFHDTRILTIFCALMMIDSVTTISGPFAIALEKELQMSRSTLILFVANLIAYPTAILVALSGFDFWSLIAINFITYTVGLVGAYLACKTRLPEVFALRWQFDRALAKHLLKQGISTGLSLAMLGIIVAQFDNFLIGTIVGETELGYYDRAYRLANWTNIIFTIIFGRIGFLTMAKVKDDHARLTHTVRLSIWGVLSSGIPVALILCFGASEIVGILYGSTYMASARFLRVLAITNFMWTLISVGFWLSVALNNQSANFRFSLLQATILVVVATPLTIWLGSTGTMIGVIAAMSVSMILYCRYILQTVSLHIGETFAKTALITLITIAVLFLLKESLQSVAVSALVRLLSISMVTVLTFVGATLLLDRTRTLEQFHYIRRLWQK